MSEALSFDLTPIEEPVTLDGKNYILREASEDAACRWRGHAIRHTKMSDGKVSGVGGEVADLEPLLVSMCLFPEGERKPVALNVIRDWPSRVVKPIFARAKEISGLDEKDTTEELEKEICKLQAKLDKLRAGESPAKNSPESTPDT